MALALALATSKDAAAQTPTPVVGPWEEMDQVVCFTKEDATDKEECSNESVTSGTSLTYNNYYGQRFEYGKDRREQCYHTHIDGPKASDVNALYLMMSCRVGLAVGGITWVGVGIALMAVCWIGFKRIIESMGSSNSEGSSLRQGIGSVVVGLILMFSAYPLTLLIHTAAKYNFLKYLYDPNMWGSP
ncbi:MAG: hypothetical protein OXI16_13975 [Chloroflexota bacterium]|nr:hypothetical protein [Chloroflexota bacterium]